MKDSELYSKIHRHISDFREKGLTFNLNTLNSMRNLIEGSQGFYVNNSSTNRKPVLSVPAKGSTLSETIKLKFQQRLNESHPTYVMKYKNKYWGGVYINNPDDKKSLLIFSWDEPRERIKDIFSRIDFLEAIISQTIRESILEKNYKEVIDKNDQLLEITSQVEAMLSQLKHRDQIRGVIYAANQSISYDMSIEEVLETYCYHLSKLKYRSITLLYDRRVNGFELKATSDKGLQKWFARTFPVEPGNLWEYIQKQTSGVIIDNIALYVDSDWEFLQAVKSREFILLPIITNRQIAGVLFIDKIDPMIPFSSSEKSDLDLFALQVGMQFSNIKQFKELSRFYETDPLTGVPNRRYLTMLIQDEIKRSMRYKQPFSLIMLDIDHFKRFNDTYGHLAGDIILKLIADNLSRTIRENDILTRYGGEEFIILSWKNNNYGAVLMAERLRKRIEKISISEVFLTAVRDNKLQDDVLIKYKNTCVMDTIGDKKRFQELKKSVIDKYSSDSRQEAVECMEIDLLKKMREDMLIDDLTFETIDSIIQGHNVSLTISCGVATYPEDGNNSTHLISSADGAMYHAKKTGRNRVVSHSSIKKKVSK